MPENRITVSGTTKVFGIIGDPVAHSLSPLMQNIALATMGFDGVYVPFKVAPEHLGEAVTGLRTLGIAGFNVTVPHKTSIIRYLDELTPVARNIGAVNTVVNHNGRFVGDNTDVYGFKMCLQVDGGIEELPERVAVLGAGGAARSVVYACATTAGTAEVIILNRTVVKAEALAADMTKLTGTVCTASPVDDDTLMSVLSGCGLVVNTTSVGMHPDTERSPVPDPSVFHSGQTVCDIIYTPLETRLLRDAAAAGAKTVGGLAMLAYQGARALSLWTGCDAPGNRMFMALRSAIGH